MSETLDLAADAARTRDDASPELLLQHVRDLLAEYRMALQERRERHDGDED